MLRNPLISALGAFLVCTGAGFSAPLTLDSSTVLGIQFDIQFPLSGYNGVVLQALSGSRSNLLTVNASMFNGSALLGTDAHTETFFSPLLSGSYLAIWLDNSAPAFPGSPSGRIDYSSIANGSIAGRIEFRISGGTLNLDTDDLRLQFTQTFPGGLASTTSVGGPRIQAITVNGSNVFQAPPVPEPSTYALAAIGAALVAGRRLLW